MVRLHAVIRGDVQGVGFRWHMVDTARQLRLRGWGRNRDDGAVELTAEGERAQLDRLLQAASTGPRGATVSDVTTDWSEAAGNLGPFQLVH